MAPLGRNDEKDLHKSNRSLIGISIFSVTSEATFLPPPIDFKEMVEQTDERPPFLDTFYGITDSSAKKRAQAASDMLLYVKEGTEDAKYALKRLLNGLCSGRASARQGNAAALVSFLKAVQDSLDDIVGDELPPTECLRERLISVTDIADCKKASDERDHQFGRLFGILSFIKSGLFVDGSACLLAKDLVELYEAKRWMREHAAHALCLLLLSIKSNVSLWREVVEVHVIPALLLSKQLRNAEQVAVALCIQTEPPCKLRAPLNTEILTNESIPTVAEMLSQTSSVTAPRVHLVWDVLASYVSERDVSTSAAQTHHVISNKIELVNTIFEHVVHKLLLGAGGSKRTHERSALALSLARNFLGVEFISCITGRMQLGMNEKLVEAILSPPMVKLLFTDIISSGKLSGRHQAEHILQPMAMGVLESIVAAASKSSEKRLLVACSLLNSTPRFDALTKTTCVEDLVFGGNESVSDCLKDYLGFLETKITAADQSDADLVALLELLHRAGRYLSRMGIENKENSQLQRILNVMMLLAFFDCKAGLTNSKGTKKKKRKSSLENLELLSDIEFTQQVRLSHEARLVVASRFFSLLTEIVKSESTKEAIRVLNGLIKMSNEAVKLGCNRLRRPDDDMELDEKAPLDIVCGLCNTVNDLGPEATAASRYRESVAFLACALLLHDFSCGPSIESEEDLDHDDEQDTEAIRIFLSDLDDLSLQHTDGPSDGFLEAYSELFCNILSSPVVVESALKGGISKILRDAVKSAWIAVLSLAAVSDRQVQISEEVLHTLLQAAGIETNSRDEDSSDDDESEEESVFQRTVMMDDADEMTRESDANNYDDKKDDVHVEPGRVASLLHEDIDDDSIDETQLEHHEGADEALAKLIQLKQDARKAGQQAIEKVEVSRRLRCVVLLEVMSMGKTDGWGKLLGKEHVILLVEELLKYHGRLDKSIMRDGGSHDVAMGNRKSLRDKIHSIIKSKLLKMKPNQLKWSEQVDGVECCSVTLQNTLDGISTKTSPSHDFLVAQCMVFTARCIESASKRVEEVGRCLHTVVNQWASKRTKLETVLDAFIHNVPVLSQATLTPALALSATEARSAFLKAESFKILTVLFNRKLTSPEPELDKAAAREMIASAPAVANSIVEVLSGDDMKKSKRAREVLKAAERFTAYFKGLDHEPSLKAVFASLSEALSSFSSESTMMMEQCEKVLKEIQTAFDSSEREAKQSDGKKKSKGKKSKRTRATNTRRSSSS